MKGRTFFGNIHYIFIRARGKGAGKDEVKGQNGVNGHGGKTLRVMMPNITRYLCNHYT